MRPIPLAPLIGSIIGLSLGGRFGFFLGLLGCMAGWWVGAQLQRGMQNSGGIGIGPGAQARQQIIFESIFLAMGHLAKADGRVSEEEIQAARSFMHRQGLRPEEARVAIELFTRGKQPNFPLEAQMERLGAACQGQPDLIRAFMEILFEIPLSKGRILPQEREVLRRAAAGLGLGPAEFAAMESFARARHSFGHQTGGAQSTRDQLADAYKALGVEATATDKEVKTAYRRLMNQHHPDKLVSKGLPESMLEAAKERTREIRAAYEKIKEARGFK
ncbi:MAG: co-chaperone DjlA [Gammaproteobacteria bacterium]